MTRNGEKLARGFIKVQGLPSPDFVSSRNSCDKLKPEKDQFEIIHKKFGFDKKNYLLIGDSHHDEGLAHSVDINFKRVIEGNML